MSQNGRRPLAELLADRALIDAAIQRAAREAILLHPREGRDVPAFRDGKVVWVPAEVLSRLLNESNGTSV